MCGQHEKILDYMKPGEAYRLTDFCSLLGLKESRTKEILKVLANMGKIELIGNKKDRRYRKTLN